MERSATPGGGRHPGAAGRAGADFDEFYDRALPVVYGYLLRLCGGDADRAWDLTQDAWVTLVRQMKVGNPDKVTVAYLISIAPRPARP